MKRIIISTVVVCLLAIATSLSAQSLRVGNNITTPNSSDSTIAPIRTDIDLVSPANATGSLTNATFGWSTSGCTAAVKIKFFRRQGNTLVFLTDRGPFNTSGTNSVALSPPVDVQQGDLIGIALVADCGNPVALFGFPTAGYVQYPSDLSSNVDLAAGVQQTSVLAVQATGTATESVARIITVGASAPGAFGSFFRTTVQLNNPFGGTSPLTGRFIFHPAGVTGSFADPALSFSVAPGETRTFPDLIGGMGLSGLGSLDVVIASDGSVPVTVVRLFNDAGAAGTTGFTEELVDPSSSSLSGGVISGGTTAVLIGPPDVTNFRFNIGVRTLFSGAILNIRQLDPTGATVRTNTRSYPPTFFEQVDAATFLGGALGANQTIQVTVSSGSAIVYGATTDNTTNDPSLQFAKGVFAVAKQ